jgi:hypothetical protein
VSRIVTALEAHHRDDPIGQQIDYLAFALVTPLHPDYYDVLAHALITFPRCPQAL